jgi:hypothetical protein
MYTNPSASHMIEAVMAEIKREILPQLQQGKAKLSAELCLAILQCVANRVPVEQQLCVQECKEMRELFRELAQMFEGENHRAAIRLRERAQEAQDKGLFNGMPNHPEIVAAHRALSDGLVHTLDDLDALIAAGSKRAPAALEHLRAYLGMRAGRDFNTHFGPPVTAAMAGRK